MSVSLTLQISMLQRWEFTIEDKFKIAQRTFTIVICCCWSALTPSPLALDPILPVWKVWPWRLMLFDVSSPFSSSQRADRSVTMLLGTSTCAAPYSPCHAPCHIPTASLMGRLSICTWPTVPQPSSHQEKQGGQANPDGQHVQLHQVEPTMLLCGALVLVDLGLLLWLAGLDPISHSPEWVWVTTLRNSSPKSNIKTYLLLPVGNALGPSKLLGVWLTCVIWFCQEIYTQFYSATQDYTIKCALCT